jgi:hypothetical protein
MQLKNKFAMRLLHHHHTYFTEPVTKPHYPTKRGVLVQLQMSVPKEPCSCVDRLTPIHKFALLRVLINFVDMASESLWECVRWGGPSLSGMQKQSACAALHSNLSVILLYLIFPHSLSLGTILTGKKFNIIKCEFSLPYNFCLKLRILPYIKIYIYRCARLLVRFQWNLNFLDRFSKNTEITNFTKMWPVRAGLFQYRHDEAHSLFL